MPWASRRVASTRRAKVQSPKVDVATGVTQIHAARTLQSSDLCDLAAMQESASQHHEVRIENASVGYDLASEILISESPGTLPGGPSDCPIMSPGGECFAP